MRETNDKQIVVSLSKKYRIPVNSIVEILKGCNENVSQYVCQAVVEKYQRDKQLGLFGTEGIVQPVFHPMVQPVPIQPIQQPIPPTPQPIITVQEQKADVIAEPIQESKDDESETKDENQALAIEFRKKYCDDDE